MSNHADLLIEIHTEELPPKALSRLGKAFLSEIEERLRKAELSFAETQFFATPRRLAVFIKNLAAGKAARMICKSWLSAPLEIFQISSGLIQSFHSLSFCWMGI